LAALGASASLLSVHGQTGDEGMQKKGRSLDVARTAVGSALYSVSQPEGEADRDRFPALSNSDAQYLISDDEVLSTMGKRGTNIYLLTIRGKHEIDSFSFFNYGGSGVVSLEGLAQPIINKSQKWIPLSDPVSFSGTGPVHIVFDQPRVIRAVKVTMNIIEEGEFSGFGVAGIFSPDQLEKMEIVEVPEDTTLNSVIVPSQISRIAGVTPGPATAGPQDPERMIDDLVETTYEFNTQVGVPAVLIDLGQDRNVERISALITTDKPALMEVYMISDVEDALPGDNASRLRWPQQPGFASAGISPFASLFPSLTALTIQQLIYLSPEEFQDLKPIAVAECPVDDPRIVIELETAYTTRFILIRWIPQDDTDELLRFLVHELNLMGRYNWRFYDIAPAIDNNNYPQSFREIPPLSK
jgi:hypothetical protein